MTKLEALNELLAKVEAGKFNGAMEVAEEFFAGTPNVAYVNNAYRGSLDAAEALHEALLPEMGWEVEWVAKYPNLTSSNNGYPYRSVVGWGKNFVGSSDTPARAWLICILKALIAKEQEA